MRYQLSGHCIVAGTPLTLPLPPAYGNLMVNAARMQEKNNSVGDVFHNYRTKNKVNLPREAFHMSVAIFFTIQTGYMHIIASVLITCTEVKWTIVYASTRSNCCMQS